MSSDLTTFVCQGIAADGSPFVAGGFCRCDGGAAASTLRRALGRFRPGPVADAFDVDLRVAQVAAEACPPGITILGVSIAIAGAPGPSGGIIGDPQSPPASAHRPAEDMGGGFAVAARPGGPGIAVFGPRRLAKQLLDAIGPDSSSDTPADLCETARRHGAPLALAVTDGTGTPEPGAVAVLQHGTIRSAALPHRAAAASA